MSARPVPLGHLSDSNLHEMAGRIKLRALCRRGAASIVVYVDEGQVYAVREDSASARFVPEGPDALIGAYTGRLPTASVVADLEHARELTRAAT